MSSFAALVTSMFDKVAALGDDIGTAAMFLVGGSILVHNIEMLHHLQQDVMKLAP